MNQFAEYIVETIGSRGWPTGIHKEIATAMGISNYESTKYINALLHLKRIKK